MVLLYINNHQHSGHRWAIILASAKPETLQAPDHVTRMSWTAASTLSARIRNLNSDQEPHMLVDVGMTWLGLNIVHSISISIQINQVKYIYLSSPKDIHGYPISFYVFFAYIHCSIDRWNISLFYLYFYIHHYPNNPRSKHILLTYIIYHISINIRYPMIIQWLSQDIHGLLSYI